MPAGSPAAVPALGGGLGSGERVWSSYLFFEWGVTAVCPLVEAADFGPFGGLLGPF